MGPFYDYYRGLTVGNFELSENLRQQTERTENSTDQSYLGLPEDMLNAETQNEVSWRERFLKYISSTVVLDFYNGLRIIYRSLELQPDGDISGLYGLRINEIVKNVIPLNLPYHQNPGRSYRRAKLYQEFLELELTFTAWFIYALTNHPLRMSAETIATEMRAVCERKLGALVKNLYGRLSLSTLYNDVQEMSKLLDGVEICQLSADQLWESGSRN